MFNKVVWVITLVGAGIAALVLGVNALTAADLEPAGFAAALPIVVTTFVLLSGALVALAVSVALRTRANLDPATSGYERPASRTGAVLALTLLAWLAVPIAAVVSAFMIVGASDSSSDGGAADIGGALFLAGAELASFVPALGLLAGAWFAARPAPSK